MAHVTANGVAEQAIQHAHELQRATHELREACRLVSRLTSAGEVTERLRDIPGLIDRLSGQALEAERRLQARIGAHEACATQLAQATAALERQSELVEHLLRVAEIPAKIERINAFIDLLDRAELIRWHDGPAG